MDRNDLEGNIVRITYRTEKPMYGYVIRQVEGKLNTYVVATEAYPEGCYYDKRFLEWTDDEEITEFVERNIIPYYENSGWNGFIPDNVEPYTFFAEMAEIAPGLNEKGKKMKFDFHVCVFEGGEGPVPHIHIYYGKKSQNYDDHGNVIVSHVCLGKNEYAPQHAEETKKLNHDERKELVKFLSSKIVDPFNGSESTPWLEAVKHWMNYHKDWKKHFKFDENGVPIMPDYSTINMPQKNSIDRFKGQIFRM